MSMNMSMSMSMSMSMGMSMSSSMSIRMSMSLSMSISMSISMSRRGVQLMFWEKNITWLLYALENIIPQQRMYWGSNFLESGAGDMPGRAILGSMRSSGRRIPEPDFR